MQYMPGLLSKYNPELILTLNFGKYGKEAHDLVVPALPLKKQAGFRYLKDFLRRIPSISNTDRVQIEAVCRAYEDFPVRIKCTGKDGECKELATNILLPYQFVDGGFRDVMFARNSFYCPECSDEKSDLKTEKIGINFSSLKPNDDVYIHGAKVHRNLKELAFQLISQDIDDVIDTRRMNIPARMAISDEGAQLIVNKLLGIKDLQRPLPGLEGVVPQYKKRPIYFITKNPRLESRPKQESALIKL